MLFTQMKQYPSVRLFSVPFLVHSRCGYAILVSLHIKKILLVENMTGLTISSELKRNGTKKRNKMTSNGITAMLHLSFDLTDHFKLQSIILCNLQFVFSFWKIGQYSFLSIFKMLQFFRSIAYWLRSLITDHK